MPVINPVAPRRAAFVLVLAAALCGAAPFARAQEAPDAIVKRVATDVIASIKADPAIQAGNEARIRDVLEAKLLPNFDFARMTALAMGKNWRSATPEQQKRVTDEFRALLVRTYSTALSAYRNQVIDVKPPRAQSNDTEVVVRSEVKQSGAEPVTIDYSMAKTPGGWKVYDLAVNGVSLVTTYRETFATEVRAGGIDGLIKSLSAKNQQLAAKSAG